MTDASTQFWELEQESRRFPVGDSALANRYLEVAKAWTDAGNHFGAGYAAEKGIHVAWGDIETIRKCTAAAWDSYRQCIESQPDNPHEHMSAYQKMAGIVSRISWMFSHNQDAYRGIMAQHFEICDDLAQFQLKQFATIEHRDDYLVRGIWVRTDLDGLWEPLFSSYEVDDSTESSGGGLVQFGIPSAFRGFIRLANYDAAADVVRSCPDAFSTPSLRGWNAAVIGFTESEDAGEKFAEAADFLSQDISPAREELKARGSWSSINIDLWAPYFRSRSMLLAATKTPSRVGELVRHAAEAIGPEKSGWVSPIVSRYRLLIQTLAHMVGEEPGLSPQEASEQFEAGHNFLLVTNEGDVDPLIEQFLKLAKDAFNGFQADPAKEIAVGHLGRAFDVLARIPLIGQRVTDAVQPAAGAVALQNMNMKAVDQLPVRLQTTIYKDLEAISTEADLQKLLLRLLQAQLPMYAEVLHGPLEYGKDVVALVSDGAKNVLSMYQVKLGNITTPIWRTARQELEEMFQVPLSELQFPDVEYVRKGYLVTNGHPNSYVTPSIEGWLIEQQNTHNRSFKIIHLDSLVRWIVSDRLIPEFRAAIKELEGNSDS